MIPNCFASRRSLYSFVSMGLVMLVVALAGCISVQTGSGSRDDSRSSRRSRSHHGPTHEAAVSFITFDRSKAQTKLASPDPACPPDGKYYPTPSDMEWASIIAMLASNGDSAQVDWDCTDDKLLVSFSVVSTPNFNIPGSVDYFDEVTIAAPVVTVRLGATSYPVTFTSASDARDAYRVLSARMHNKSKFGIVGDKDAKTVVVTIELN